MKNGIMTRLAIWLNEHAICVGDSLKANVVHLWCVLISFVIITVFALLGWKGKAMEYLLTNKPSIIDKKQPKTLPITIGNQYQGVHLVFVIAALIPSKTGGIIDPPKNNTIGYGSLF